MDSAAKKQRTESLEERRLSEDDMEALAGRKKRLGVAIIGLGRAGSFHMTSMKAVSDIAVLRWVVDSDEVKVKEVARRESCRGTTDIEEVLKDPSVDAVIISSVTYSHYGYCKAALEANKAVFTEKPISHSPKELSEIIELAIKKGRAFIVGYQRRVDNHFRELRKQIQAGHIGGLRLIKCCSRDNPLPPLEYLRVSGGIFYDMLTHDFDMVHFLSGEVPEEVFTMGHCYNKDIEQMDDIDMVVVNMKFKSGLIATVDCSRLAAYGYDQRVEAFGEKGMATAHNEVKSTVVVGTAEGFLHPTAHWSFPQRYEQTYTTELVEFVTLVKNGGVEPEDVVRRHIVLERVTAASELSYRLGRAIKLTEVEGLRAKLPH